MNCIKCGNILSPTDTICPKCNTKVGQSNEVVAPNTNEVPVLLTDTVETPVEEAKIQTPIVDQMNQTAQTTQVKEEPKIEELSEQAPAVTESRSKVEMTPMTIRQGQYNMFRMAIFSFLIIFSITGGVMYGMHAKSLKAVSEEVAIKNSYNVRIGNITYKIPSNYMYTQIENGIEVSDKDETWIADIGPMTVNYNDIRTYAKSISDLYTKYKYKVSEIQTKTLNGREYMTMEVTRDSQSILIAFSNANSTITHLIIVKNKDNTIDYKALEEVANVLNNSKVNDNGVEIRTNEVVLDFATISKSIVNTTVTQKRIAEARQKAAQEKANDKKE